MIQSIRSVFVFLLIAVFWLCFLLAFSIKGEETILELSKWTLIVGKEKRITDTFWDCHRVCSILSKNGKSCSCVRVNAKNTQSQSKIDVRKYIVKGK